MSIPDELMWSYYSLLTDKTPNEILVLRRDVSSGKLHPMDAKMRLAEEVISDFHGKEAARKAGENFQRVFRDRQVPEEVEEKRWLDWIGPTTQSLPLAKLIFALRLTTSRSEAERLIKQGAVEWDGSRVEDPSFQVRLEDIRDGKLLRVGKLRVVAVTM